MMRVFWLIQYLLGWIERIFAFFCPLFIEIRQDLIRLGPVENLLIFYCAPSGIFHQAPSANVPVFIPCNKRML